MERPDPVGTALEDDPRVTGVNWNGDQFGRPVVVASLLRDDEAGEVVFMPTELQNHEDPHAFMIEQVDALFAARDGAAT